MAETITSQQADYNPEDYFKPNKYKTSYYLKRYKTFYLMLVPCVFFFAIFSYWPMAGLILAFREFRFDTGMFGGDFVGLEYFEDFFSDSRSWLYIRNTLVISAIKLFVYLPFPILLALVFNELKNKQYQRITQSVSYLPYFVSWVVVIGVINRILAPNTGILNEIIGAFGGETDTFWMLKEFCHIKEYYMKQSANSGRLSRYIIATIIFLLCLSIVLPFIHILALAFNEGQDATRGGIVFWPRVWTLENFQQVFQQGSLLNGLLISVFRTVTVTVIGVFLMAMAAYALTIRELPGKGFFTFFIFFTLLFGEGTIPYYLVLSNLNLTHSIWVYIFPNLYSATNILLLRSSFLNLPTETFEAARIDGTSEFNIFMRLVLPMSKPVLATISLFTAVGQWNDWFSGSFYVRQQELKPLATLLQKMLTRQEVLGDLLCSQQGFSNYAQLSRITITGQSLQMATIIVVMLPIVITYPFIQKYFVKGITIGSIKG